MSFREESELVLGRGEVYFQRFPDDLPAGDAEFYLGNTPSFQITRSVERMESYRSYRGKKQLGQGRVISESVEVRMATDNMTWDNISLWFGGGETTSGAGDDFVPFTENFNVQKGGFYQLGKAHSPAGFYAVDNAIVQFGATVLIEGVHYDFEGDLGRIRILPTAPDISNGEIFSVTYVKRVGKSNYLALNASEVYGAIRYISRNPHGLRTDYWFPKVRIAPQGVMEMKGDEFQQMRFNITAVRQNPTVALLYAMQFGEAPKPITADTTLITADSTLYRADNDAWERRN